MRQTEQTKWSERSQRSLVRENELRVKLNEVEALLSYEKQNVLALEAQKAAYLARSLKGRHNPEFTRLLAGVKQELKNSGDAIELHEEQKTMLASELGKLSLNPAQTKARAEQQGNLFTLATRRLQKDREIDAALVKLREVLQERAALTGDMSNAAEAADVTMTNYRGQALDVLDAARFGRLAASLPLGDFSSASELWLAGFVGERTDLKSYIVRDRQLAITEGLAHSGIYNRGEKINLTDEQAQELLREDRPAKRTNSRPWSCLPPSIMTLEAYETLMASNKDGDFDQLMDYGDFQHETDHALRWQAGQRLIS